MKVILAIIAFVFGASGASAQVIYSSIRVRVEAATPCPANWTRTSATTVAPALFFIHAPLSIGGRVFLVTSDLVDALWPSAASKAGAITSGLLVVQGEVSTVQNYCALLPSP